jgi:hypothetical protein
MKSYCFKAAATAALMLPLLAMASTSFPESSAKDTLTFALGYDGPSANNYYNLAPGNAEKYNVVVDANWTDMAYWNTKNYTVDLFNEMSGYKFSYSGKGLADSLTSTTKDAANNLIELTFAGLAQGHYTVKFTGFWGEVDDLAGKNKNWASTPGSVDLSIKSVSLVSSVPEPESYAMLLTGLGLMGTIVLRRKKSKSA